ncbi:MAG: SDR family oxidoreductase [Gemmatimonadetes bacterium]|nr:SDR family oxidoreductase [Gemmatimonadota bacterium]
MRILVLGGDGMLGHRLLKELRPRHDVRGTLRQDAAAYGHYGLFPAESSYFGVDVRSLERMAEVFADFRPEAVVNAVGIVKQRASAHDAIPSLEINSLLPHRLSVLCRGAGARLVHVSTDCVFSGEEGMYRDDDPSDAKDLYGKSKYLGEVGDPGCITLRTSIIGPELARKTGLLEWFLAQTGTIRGFRRAIFSGFTTAELARVIETLLVRHPGASGVYNVSTDPINKYDLLVGLRDRLGRDVEIVPDDDFHCDRSLDSSRFRAEFGYTPPSWDGLLDELAGEIKAGKR